MTEMDVAQLLAWLHFLTVSEDLEHALGPEGREHLSDLLDLPASYGGAGLQSLKVFADEEFLGYLRRVFDLFLHEDRAANLYQDRGSIGNARGPGCMTVMPVDGRGEGCK